jgi:antirestriction protein
MNTEKLEKLKKSLDNKFIPDNMKDKIRVEIQKLELEIKTDDTITATEVKEEVKEIEKKVEKALEVAEKKEEQAEAKAPAKTRTKRTTTSRTKKPKVEEKPTTKKKTVFSLAKEIRKADESWDDAKQRARKMMTSQTTETKAKARTETDKLLAMVRRNKEYKKLAGTSNLSKDAQRRAMPRGKRVSKTGNVYYENRANRVDVGGFKSAYLETGGGLTKYVKVYFVQGNYGSGFEDLTAHDTFLEAKKERKVYDENERNYPHRVIERRVLRTDFEKGNYADGGSITLTPETPLARGLGISYTGLVGETGAMSSGEMFAGGGQITISEIKRRTSETSPYFFDAKTMKFFNQKMSDFKVRKLENGKYEIYAPRKDYNGKSMGVTKRIFNPETNELEFTKDFATGGGVDKWIGYDKDHLMNMKNGMIVLRGTDLKDIKPKDIKGFDMLDNRGYADGGGVYANGGSTGLPAGTEQQFVNYYLGEGTAQGIYAKGGVTNERRYVNKSQDYEVRYAKSRPSRKGYKGKRSFAGGGGIEDNAPSVYIADLEAYNNGRLVGKWFNLLDYSDADEFNEAVADFLKETGAEEYAVHDFENIPRSMQSEYLGVKDFEEIYEMIDLARDKDLPLEVVMEVTHELGESAVDEFYGVYDSEEDFAEQLVDDLGIVSFNNFEYYLEISDTDKRLLAQDMADSYIEGIRDEDGGNRLIEEAGLDVEEYEESDSDRQQEMLDEATEIVYNEYYDNWYDGLDDPYSFLVEEQGLYSADDFAKADFVRVDIEKLARELEYDYTFIRYDGQVYVFNVR